jgi:hypothetical protein
MRRRALGARRHHARRCHRQQHLHRDGHPRALQSDESITGKCPRQPPSKHGSRRNRQGPLGPWRGGRCHGEFRWEDQFDLASIPLPLSPSMTEPCPPMAPRSPTAQSAGQSSDACTSRRWLVPGWPGGGSCRLARRWLVSAGPRVARIGRPTVARVGRPTGGRVGRPTGGRVGRPTGGRVGRPTGGRVGRKNARLLPFRAVIVQTTGPWQVHCTNGPPCRSAFVQFCGTGPDDCTMALPSASFVQFSVGSAPVRAHGPGPRTPTRRGSGPPRRGLPQTSRESGRIRQGTPGGSRRTPSPAPGGSRRTPSPAPSGSRRTPSPAPGGSRRAPSPFPRGSPDSTPAATRRVRPRDEAEPA